MFFNLAALFVHFADAAAPAAQAAADAAAGAVPAADTAPNSYFMPIVFVLMIVAMYFLMIAPQRKQQKEIAKQQAAMKVGDRVVTSSGIIGKVAGIDDAVITLQVSEGTRIPFQRQAIVGFLKDDDKSDKK